MNFSELKLGDVVALNSGGPHMTVSDLSGGIDGAEDGPVKCTWFDEDNAMQANTFRASCLFIPEEEEEDELEGEDVDLTDLANAEDDD